MSKIKIQLVEDEETPTVFERFWDGLMTFVKCVGAFVAVFVALLILMTVPERGTAHVPSSLIMLTNPCVHCTQWRIPSSVSKS